MEALLIVVAVGALGYAVIVLRAALLSAGRVPVLERLRPREPKRWPKVSVVIPACNEADTIERALESRLREGYPNVEYIVVDDRSTDGTGAIIDAIAERAPRVIALHVKDLPEGWLGKLHAMRVATERATGEFILYSDADVHHEPGTLTRVIAHAEEQGIDHVAVLPSLWSSTFWCDVVMNTFLRQLVTVARIWRVADASSKVAVGGGVFNLVRRSALEKAGGLEPLRLEIADDAALGQMLKWSGAKQAVLNARGFVGLYYYRSVAEAVRGMEKNAFAVLRFSVARAIALASFYLFAELGAVIALAAGGSTARLVAGSALVVLFGAQTALARWLHRPVLPFLLSPIGGLIMTFALLRSTILTLVRGGIDWRGTRYPLALLKRHMRLVLA
jgi:glycosyltransferase involved in cell wall biosynthesis